MHSLADVGVIHLILRQLPRRAVLQAVCVASIEP
jgi:hypothetical protein